MNGKEKPSDKSNRFSHVCKLKPVPIPAAFSLPNEQKVTDSTRGCHGQGQGHSHTLRNPDRRAIAKSFVASSGLACTIGRHSLKQSCSIQDDPNQNRKIFTPRSSMPNVREDKSKENQQPELETNDKHNSCKHSSVTRRSVHFASDQNLPGHRELQSHYEEKFKILADLQTSQSQLNKETISKLEEHSADIAQAKKDILELKNQLGHRHDSLKKHVKLINKLIMKGQETGRAKEGQGQDQGQVKYEKGNKVSENKQKILEEGDENTRHLRNILDERMQMMTDMQTSQSKLNQKILAKFRKHSEEIAQVNKERLVVKKDIQDLKIQQEQLKKDLKLLNRLVKESQKEKENGPAKLNDESKKNTEQNQDKGQGQGKSQRQDQHEDLKEDENKYEEEVLNGVENEDEHKKNDNLDDTSEDSEDSEDEERESYFGETESEREKRLREKYESWKQRQLDKEAKRQKKIQHSDDTRTSKIESTPSTSTSKDPFVAPLGLRNFASVVPQLTKMMTELAHCQLKDYSPFGQENSHKQAFGETKLECPCCKKLVTKSYFYRHIKHICKSSLKNRNKD